MLNFSNMKVNVASFFEFQRLFDLGPPQKWDMLQKQLQKHHSHWN